MHWITRLAFVAEETASIFTPTMSFAVTLVVVKSVKVVECSAVPVEIARYPPLRIVFPLVGIAVPVATFQTSKEIVPVSTVIFQAAIVQAKGTVT